MSSVLEPSFLLELGAYAVTVAGIRLFKNRYRRAGSQPSAKEVPDLEQPEPVQVSSGRSCDLSVSQTSHTLCKSQQTI